MTGKGAEGFMGKISLHNETTHHERDKRRNKYTEGHVLK